MTANKYNAIRSGGFDSQLEKAYAKRLELYKKIGTIKDYWRQQTVTLLPDPRVTLKVDFLVRLNDGVELYVETKGLETREFVIKRKIWENNQKNMPPLLIIKGNKSRGEYFFFPDRKIGMDDIGFEG